MSLYTKTHRYSAAFLSLFITLHLFNHSVALHSVAAHLQVMQYLRYAYRNPIVEPLLWGAILLQVYTGLRLVLQRPWKTRRDGWARWQAYTGLYLAFFLVLHTGANLYGRWGVGVDTNFYYGAAVVQARPLVYFFAPYYALGIMAYVVHLAALLRLLGMRAWGPTLATRRAWYWVAAGAVLTGLILWAFMSPTVLPEIYKR